MHYIVLVKDSQDCQYPGKSPTEHDRLSMTEDGGNLQAAWTPQKLRGLTAEFDLWKYQHHTSHVGMSRYESV